MPATPEDLGLSSQGLEGARTCVEGCVERGEIAGAVMLVNRHDQAAQLACVGMRDIEAGLPMTPDTIFRIASMTKPITSVGALTPAAMGEIGHRHGVTGHGLLPDPQQSEGRPGRMAKPPVGGSSETR